MIELNLPTPTGYTGHRLVIAELDFEVDDQLIGPQSEPPAKPASGVEKIRQQIAMIPVGEPFSALDFEGCQFVSQTLRKMAKRGDGIRMRPERLSIPRGGKPMLVYERVQ